MQPKPPSSLWVTLLVGSFAACSSASTSSPSAAPGASEDGGSASAGEDGGEVEGDASAPSGPGPFDLALTVRELMGTTPADTLFFVAVRDAESHEVVASSHDEEHSTQTFKLTKKKALQKGHRYEVGIKTGWPTGCLASTSDVWYREIPDVTANVSLAIDVTEGEGVDKKGCDVIHAPVALPPGLYAADVPIAGVSGNHVTLEVSPTGRVYTRSMQVFCGVDSNCVSTTTTHGTCELEQATYPDLQTFSLGDESGSHTAVKGTATIDAATKSIHYVGRTTTWRGTSTTCCDQSFDVVLKKTTGAPSCQ